MLFIYAFLALLLLACGIVYRVVEKKIVGYISIGAALLTFIGLCIVGWLYGKQLFVYDDPKLGSWIFMVGAWLVGFITTFIITYKDYVMVSRVVLGLAFIVGITLIVLCIEEAKVSFVNGIGTKSPGNEDSSTTSDLLRIFYTLY